MKRDSFLSTVFSWVFPVICFSVLGGSLLAVHSTGFFSLNKWGGPISQRAMDTSDYRPRAKSAFVTGAAIGALAGILVQLWRPRRPSRYD